MAKAKAGVPVSSSKTHLNNNKNYFLTMFCCPLQFCLLNAL